jgi:hypothetical protein
MTAEERLTAQLLDHLENLVREKEALKKQINELRARKPVWKEEEFNKRRPGSGGILSYIIYEA